MKNKAALILITGLPASGKTKMAKEISRRLRMPFFSVDEIKEIISERISGRENPELFLKLAISSFDVFYKNIEKILEVGGVCIAEAFFVSEFAIPKIKNLQKKFNPKIIQINLDCNLQKIEKRYETRHKKGERHKSHIASFSQVLEKYGGIEKLREVSKINLGKIIKIDTNNFKKVSYDEICREILDNL